MRTRHPKAKWERLFPEEDLPVWGHRAQRFPAGSVVGTKQAPTGASWNSCNSSHSQCYPTLNRMERKSALLHNCYCTASEVPSSVVLGWLGWAQTPEKNKSFLQLTSSVNKIKIPKNNASASQNFSLPLALKQATEVASQMMLEALLQCKSLVMEINVFLGKTISLKCWMQYLFFYQQHRGCKLHKIVP